MGIVGCGTGCVGRLGSGRGCLGFIFLLFFSFVQFLNPISTLAANESCPELFPPKPKNQKIRSKSLITPPTIALQDSVRIIDVIALVAPSFTQGRKAELAQSEIISAFRDANEYFSSSDLKLNLKKIETIADQTVFSAAERAGDSYQMLSALKKYWDVKRSADYDVAIVFAKGDFKKVYGLGYTATLCARSDWALGVVSRADDSLSSMIQLPVTLAHELGHIAGMNHDHEIDKSVGASLMWPFYTLNIAGFSDHSREQIANHLNFDGGDYCLSREMKTNRAPSFRIKGDAKRIVNLKEGKRFARAIELEGAYEKMKLSLNGKSSSKNGLSLKNNRLTFKPSFNLASRENPENILEYTLSATSDGRRVSQKVVFVVRDSN
jgi:hypothetical protein